MKKKTKRILLGTLLALAPVSLASCSFFNTSDAVVNIKNIEVTTNNNGDTVITIYYTDVNSDPTTFTIPKGSDGKEGNGIADITYEELDDASGTKVTIKFTDTSKEDVSFIVKNGEGKKGEDGAGIYEVTTERDEDNKQTKITITFTDDRDPITVMIPDGKKGEQGISVSSIQQVIDGNEYLITFFDNNGDPIDSIRISRANTWLSGTEEPTSSDGEDGDFYFETTHYYVYQKVSGSWQKIAELGAAKNAVTNHTVTFNVNDSTDEKANIVSGQSLYTIQEGMNFYSSGYDLPIAYRQGYIFSGWITAKVYNVTLGLFTNLTEVYRDMTLYAYWAKE